MRSEEERVKEETALKIRQGTDQRISLRDGLTITAEEVADGILSIKGILIKSNDQTLPENPYPQDYQTSNGDFFDAVKSAQDKMLQVDQEGKVWVKCLLREKK